MAETRAYRLTREDQDYARQLYQAGVLGKNLSYSEALKKFAIMKMSAPEKYAGGMTPEWRGLYMAALSLARYQRGLPNIPHEETEVQRDFETDNIVVKSSVRWDRMNVASRALYGTLGT